MAKIGFKISSRATLLLGRENLAKAEGAIIELIKNTYDADASLCYILFDIENDSLYIIDNGIGMTEDIIKNYWMLIGTENKQKDYISNKKRIKSGEKGIGRFALDRLGNVCEMYTKPVNSNTLLRWTVKWSDFEQPNKLLNDIEAELDYISESLTSYIPKTIINNLSNIDKEIKDRYPDHIESTFSHGTIIKITNLRDNWSEKSLNILKDYMGYLIPPTLKGDQYNICMQVSPYELPYIIKNNITDDFDYKISSNFDGNYFNVTIYRNEYDLNRIPNDIFKESPFKNYPFTKNDFENGYFKLKLSISELLNLNSNNDNELIEKIKSIGNFDFEYVFMKQASSSEKNKERFFYKEVSAYRKDWIKKNSGIKIYRDNFIVRPYGYNDADAFDWLGLNARNATDPTGVADKRKTWTVLNNQSQGTIYISRINNYVILDKSSREGIIENDYFKIFKQLIIAIIHLFEKDRAEISYAMTLYYNKINEKERIKEEANKIAASHMKQLENNKHKLNNNNKSCFGLAKGNNNFSYEKETLVKALDFSAQEKEELISELKIMRSLSTNGLITTSIAHDLRSIMNNLKMRADLLVDSINDTDYFTELVGAIKSNDQYLVSWLTLITEQVKKDKRSRKNQDIPQIIRESIRNIEPILNKKQVSIEYNDNGLNFKKQIFSSDFDSILYNLVINSCEAFEADATPNRKILISLELNDNSFIIHYSDNGNGISPTFKDPYKIFEFAITTKIDSSGENIGTGLGMYIVASTINEYNGKYVLQKDLDGFGLDIMIPLRSVINK